jgi:hypothetical protein
VADSRDMDFTDYEAIWRVGCRDSAMAGCSFRAVLAIAQEQSRIYVPQPALFVCLPHQERETGRQFRGERREALKRVDGSAE